MTFERISKLVLILVLSTLGILPAAIGFPTLIGPPGPLHDITWLLLGCVIAFDVLMLVLAMRRQGANAKAVLNFVACLATISVGASLLMGFIRYPRFNVPIPQILTTALHLDGQPAYEADEFELYCELWFSTAVLFGLCAWGWKRLRRYSSVSLNE